MHRQGVSCCTHAHGHRPLSLSLAVRPPGFLGHCGANGCPAGFWFPAAVGAKLLGMLARRNARMRDLLP